MTIDRMALKTLVEKGSDDDLLREMMAYVANRMMDMEVESLTGAAHGERSPARTNHRNGYRERAWETPPARSIWRSRSSGKAAISRAFWSRAARARRR